jgi:hypothetical protein
MSRRLFPKIRLSWSAYRSWKKGDIDSLKNYYLEVKEEPNEYMIRGSRIHKQMEFLGIPEEVKKLSKSEKFETEKYFEIEVGESLLVGYIDVLGEDIIVDYKTGGMSGYTDQMNLYNWAMGGKREMYLVKIGDDLKVKKIQKTKLKKVDWENELKKMSQDINNLFTF